MEITITNVLYVIVFMILFLFYSLMPCLSGVSLQWKKSLILENILSNTFLNHFKSDI